MLRLVVSGLLLATALPALAQDFPRTVTTALGDALIEAEPQRIVTWGWSAQDVLLDLGVMPVGMPFFSYGGGEGGVLPWTEDKIAETGGTPPVVLPDAGEPPIEAIAALRPDLILAPYSGLTEEEFATLSRIAPVVGYPTTPWVISWQDTVTLIGEALGREDDAAALVEETTALLEAEVARYPALDGLVFANIANRNDGMVSVRRDVDTRVRLMTDLGLVNAPDVPGAEPRAGGFNYFLSYENFDLLEADLLLSYFDVPGDADAFFSQPFIALSPLVARGDFVAVEDEAVSMAVGGAVTPLSLRYGFPQVIERMGEVAERAASR